MKLTPLCELAAKYQTDKGGAHNHYNGSPNDGTHGYTQVYWKLLHDRKLQVRSVLEVGINSGASLRMWRDFFPYSRVIGLDIASEYLFSEDGIECYLADAANSQSLHDALVRAGRLSYDLIIDDGSHDPEHQKAAIRALCPKLATGGIMVVEDIHVPVADVAAAVSDGYWHETLMSEGGSGKYAHPEPLLIIRRNRGE